MSCLSFLNLHKYFFKSSSCAIFCCLPFTYYYNKGKTLADIHFSTVTWGSIDAVDYWNKPYSIIDLLWLRIGPLLCLSRYSNIICFVLAKNYWKLTQSCLYDNQLLHLCLNSSMCGCIDTALHWSDLCTITSSVVSTTFYLFKPKLLGLEL